MLIFDSFPNRSNAENFAKSIKQGYGLHTTVHDTQAEAHAIEFFPSALEPPIVLVERPDGTAEERIVDTAKGFGGHFAGT